MTVTAESKPNRGLAVRLFSNPYFGISWAGFLALIVYLFWPLRNALLVLWVYGREAYFQGGIRVLNGKPTRFSNGTLAPNWPDLATGALAFFVVTFGLSMLLIFALRLYERTRKGNDAGQAR